MNKPDARRRAAAHGRVHYRVELNGAAAEVWRLVGPFDSLPRWHPLVSECPLEREQDSGAILRRIRLHDGTVIVNRLTGHSDSDRSYGYELVEGPLPVAFYRSTLRILERKGGCTLDWSSEFDPGDAPEDEVRRRVESLIGPGVDALKRRFGV